MGFDAESIPSDLRVRIDGSLARCMAGEISPPVALMQLLSALSDRDDAMELIVRCIDHLSTRRMPAARARMEQMRDLARGHADSWARLRGVASRAQPAGQCDAQEAIRHWAGIFDEIVAISPEASVALYSLGDPALLDEFTREVADALLQWGLLGRGRVALDFGCGIGRFAAALADELRLIVGLDISEKMLEQAGQRCSGRLNASFLKCRGHDLAMIASDSIDLVLAIDSFPYVVQSGGGAAQILVTEIARALRPGGDLLIANYSYRGDVAGDRAELARIAGAAGLAEARFDPRPFRNWDGVVFQFKRPR